MVSFVGEVWSSVRLLVPLPAYVASFHHDYMAFLNHDYGCVWCVWCVDQLSFIAMVVP